MTNPSRHALPIAPGLRSAAATVVLASLVLAGPAAASGDLVIFPEPTTLGILIVFFALLVAPLNALIFRPLFRVIDERDAKIAGAREEAEGLVTKADELTGEYRSGVRRAREDAEAARKEQLAAAKSEQESITGAARAETEDEIGRARAEIQASLDEARASLEASSRDLAKVAAERILGRPL